MTHLPHLLSVPQFAAPHGFSTRQGGVSEGVYTSLNLGLSTGDDPARVTLNRQRVVAALGATMAQVCALEQVHGAEVVVARPGWHQQRADALITDDPGLLLVISVADCLPLLFYDAARGVVGAAHAGWRGTVRGVAAAVVASLRQHYGTRPEDVQVACGPAIQGACYQVGPEVQAAFAAAGFPDSVARPDAEGRYRLDLVAANRHVLERSGVPAKQIFSLDLCTHCDPRRFYSHRRDALARGSHWALIRLPSPAHQASHGAQAQ